MKWKVAFIAQKETWVDGESEVEGFKLGPSDYKIPLSQAFVVANHLNTYFFMVFNADLNEALIAYNWDEFRGAGQKISDCYKDVLARVILGIGHGTINEVKYMIRAHYSVGGNLVSSNIHDFETAGSPEPCYFTNLIDLFGVE